MRGKEVAPEPASYKEHNRFHNSGRKLADHVRALQEGGFSRSSRNLQNHVVALMVGLSAGLAPDPEPYFALLKQKLSKDGSSAENRHSTRSIDLELILPETNSDLPPNTVGLKVNHLPKGVKVEIFNGERLQSLDLEATLTKLIRSEKDGA